LQHRLLQLAGAGTKQRRDWIAPGKKGKKNKLAEWLMTQYPTLNDAELELMIETNTKADLVDVMEQQGMTTKEIKDLFK
jgi:hypothetical protein